MTKKIILFSQNISKKDFLPFEQEPIILERSARLNLGPDRGDKGTGDGVTGMTGMTGVKR